MKISAIRLFNVRRFANRGVAIEGIGDGVNVLSAANEYGKSTSFEALHALFFHPHSGTPGDVKSLRPYSGGNPLVEADISTEEGRFRITKQYIGARSARVTDLATGRLVAQADEAENFIANLIRGGTAGPAGLLWVRQGITGIERQTGTEKETERQARASLLESVQGEVEAVTGGRRMAEIMKIVTSELEQRVSKKGPKAGSHYLAAVEERDRLAAEEKRLAGEVAALRQALDNRVAVQKQLAELDRAEDRAERRKAVSDAQAAFDAARAQAERLKAAAATLDLARERHDLAKQALEKFRSALERSKRLQERLRENGIRRDGAIASRRKVVEAIETARHAAETAEVAELRARDRLARLENALKAREYEKRIAEMGQRLQEAEELRQSIEQGEAQLANLAVPPDALDTLQDLEVEIARLRATEDAARPTVEIAYDGAFTGHVTMDGVPLVHGEERGYAGRAELVLPDIGAMTLRSNRPTGSDDHLKEAEAKRRTLLAAAGVEDLPALRQRQVRAERLQGEIRELRIRLVHLAPEGMAKLREEILARTGTDEQVLELDGDPDEIRQLVADAAEDRNRTRQARIEAEALRESAESAVVSAETEMASLNAEKAQVDDILGPEEDRDAREKDHARTLEDRALNLSSTEARVDELRKVAVDLESAEASLKRARSADEAAEKEIARYREEIAGLSAEIRARSEDAVEEKWRETVDKLSAAEARVTAFEREVAGLRRLLSALETARSEARELYLKPVMAELKPLLGLLFDDVAITFDEKSLLPQTIRRNGQEEDVDRLSGGMREQLSVLTRLAFARLLARDGRPAPVILDDALVFSDDDRIEKMFDALHRQSKDLQIIVFTCRQRAFQRLGGNILHMTDWQP